MARKTTPAELLELVFSQMELRIADFTPADLNALAKTLISAKQQESEKEIVPRATSNVTSFLNRNNNPKVKNDVI